jgi:carbon-monoxide dehydrogenase iron sulfur subunit
VKKVYVNEDVCMGCGLCRVYCRTEHSEMKDIVKSYKKEIPRPLPRVRVEKLGANSFSVQCQHCEQPWCVYSCLTGAMTKDPVTGVVTVDENKCMGCWTCIVACPNGALTRDISKKVVAKCDLCPDRELPVCVANCPNGALSVA